MHAELLQTYRLSPHIDLVLLSHSPTSYTSLYPYARTHWGLKCPVYGTQPTVEVGRLGCLEEAVGWRNEVDVDGLHGLKEKDKDVNGDEQNEEKDKEQGDGLGREQEEEVLKGPFVCTAEEINEAFDHIKAVRYSQPIHLSGKSLVICIIDSQSLQRLN
jgi:cleavage and polyadenylation specificity factor subunit 2